MNSELIVQAPLPPAFYEDRIGFTFKQIRETNLENITPIQAFTFQETLSFILVAFTYVAMKRKDERTVERINEVRLDICKLYEPFGRATERFKREIVLKAISLGIETVEFECIRAKGDDTYPLVNALFTSESPTALTSDLPS